MSQRLCLAVDVEDYSGRTVPGQELVQADLAHLLDGAWHPLRADRQASGDGEVAVAAADVDPSAALSHLAGHLVDGLAALQAAGRRQRLRVAAHVGHVEAGANGFVGHAVVRTCRMVGSAPLRRCLDEHPGANLALMVSEPVWEDVVAPEVHALRAADFRPVDVRDPAKAFTARAWVHVPGVAGSRTGPGRTSVAGLSVQVAEGGVVGQIVQIGELRLGRP